MKSSVFFSIVFFFSVKGIAQCDPTYTFTVKTKLDTATVTFKANDTTPGLQHSWQFGNLFYDTGAIFTYHFTVPGPYNVMHTIRSASGDCIDSISYYYIWLDFPVTCDAEFTLTRDSSRDGMYVLRPVTFGGTSTFYEITIDGVSGGAIDPQEMFIDEGNHQVCLTVKYFDCTASSCQTLFVPPFCNWQASFTYEASSSNQRSFHFEPGITSHSMKYSWSFGDGATSSSINPTHDYSKFGQYEVKLKVTDSSGHCSDSATMQVYVSQLPGEICNASFSYSVDPNNPLRYIFTTQSDEQIVYQKWHFVAGDSSHVFETEEINPTHVFPGAGNYFVLLELTTSTDCRDFYWVEINISPADLNGNNAIIMPNPVYGSQIQLQMQFEKAEPVKIIVYNASGNIVYTSQKVVVKGVNQFAVPVGKLQRGLYYMSIQGGSSKKKSTFIKM